MGSAKGPGPQSPVMAHTFDPSRAEKLDDVARYRYLSRDELVPLLDPGPGDVLLDLGSGTGFYTIDLARYFDRVVAVDLQPAMHGLLSEKGVPSGVRLVTGAIGSLPVTDDTVDVAISTMTFHEFVGEGALVDVARAVRPGGRLVVADWTATGEYEMGPPEEERFDAASAADAVADAGFDVVRSTDRPETFVLVADRRQD